MRPGLSSSNGATVVSALRAIASAGTARVGKVIETAHPVTIPAASKDGMTKPNGLLPPNHAAA